MARIHPSAVVSEQASFGEDVEIGANVVIEGDVRLGDGVRVLPGAQLIGPLAVGERTEIGRYACIGTPGQDFKFKAGMVTAGVEIGSGNVLREYTTVHQATNDHTATRIGNDCYLMVGAHLGHDCKVGNNVVLCNNVLLGGHAQVADRANLGGGAVVHQHTRVGRLVMVGGISAVRNDVPPFMLLDGRGKITGLNLIGLRRNGFDAETIRVLRSVFRDLLRTSIARELMLSRLEAISETCAPVGEIAAFIKTSTRGISPIVVYSSRG